MVPTSPSDILPLTAFPQIMNRLTSPNIRPEPNARPASDSTITGIGFIGLGAMGKPTAEQLAAKLQNKVKLIVYDIVDSVIKELVETYAGKVIAGTSPVDVAGQSQIIFSMVPEGAHVKNAILIDCSTIDVATSLAVKDHITTHHPDASFYDAPSAIAFFLGCSKQDPNRPRLTELLNLMGKEALIMGMCAGLDPRVLSSVFAAGTGQNTIIDRFNPCPGVAPQAPSTRGYQGGFKVQLMKKDFSLAVAMAREQGTQLVLGDAGLKTYQDAADNPRCRDLDSRVVFRHLGGDEKWNQRFETEQ
ncbi:6-phosphogluconate dehydrogenase [Aspergillus spectabilis]